MGKVKILIVEDEIIIADQMAVTLKDLGYDVLEPAISYEEALEVIEAERPDLGILDIHLSGKKNGIDLAEKINLGFQFPFIFLTSNTDKFTLNEAKRAEPYAYLVKPYSPEELYASIEIALYNYSQKKEQAVDKENLIIQDALFIKQNKIFLRLNFADILYLVSDHVYIDIIMADQKKYTVRGSLNEYILKLGPSFIRSHRSYIVNLNHLQGINHAYVVIKDQEVPLGKRYREEILKKVQTG